MGYVDRVAVKVWPDAREFDRDMRRTTEKRRKTLIRAVLDAKEARAELKKLENSKTGLDLEMRTEKARAKLKELKAQIAADIDKTVTINADIREARTRVAQLRADLAEVTDKDTKANIRADISKAMAEVKRFQAKLAEVRNHKLEVQVEATKARKELSDLEKDRKVVYQAQVDSINARRELIMLARKRVAEIFVWVNKTKAMADIRRIMNGLTGLSMLRQWRDSLVKLLENLPQTTLKVAALGSALAALVVPAMSALSAMAPIGATIADILPVLLGAIPLFGGLASAVAIFAMSFTGLDKSAGPAAQRFIKVLDGITPKLTAIKDAVQEAFFKSGFTEAFDNLTTAVLPKLKKGLSGVAVGLGDMTAGVMDALNDGFANGKLERFFANMKVGIDAAMPGVKDITTALTTIGLEGSENFGAIGAWVTKIGAQFREWTETSDIAGMMREAAVQAGFLWDATKNLGSVIAGIFRGMDTGKSTGLESFAATLGKLREIVWSSGFQSAMRNIFTGAAIGAAALSDAMGPVGSALEKLAPLIGQVFNVFGTAAADALVGITEALAQPVAQAGIGAALQGISDLMANMPWDALGLAIGAIGMAMGLMAPLVSEILNALAPVLPEIISAVSQLIPPITQVVRALLPMLVAAIRALVPIISALAPVIVALVPVLAAVATVWGQTFLPVLQAIGPVIEKITPFIVWLGSLIADTVNMVAALMRGDWSKAWDLALGIVRKISDGIKAVMVAMVTKALAAIASWASGMGVKVKAMWDDTVRKASAGVSKVVEWVDKIFPGAKKALEGAGGVLLAAGKALLQGFWDGAKRVWEDIKTWIGGLADWIAKHKGPLTYDYQLLQPAGKAIMGGFKDAMSAGMRDVEGLVSDFAPAIRSNVMVAAGKQGGAGDSLISMPVMVDGAVVGWIKSVSSREARLVLADESLSAQIAMGV